MIGVLEFTAIVATIALVGILILCGLLLYRSVHAPKELSPDHFVELLAILNSIIDAHINTYETSIFNGLNNKGSITNNNFDNYYRTMNNEILEDISDELMAGLEGYYTHAAIIKFIARKVRDYLVTKIQVNTTHD